MKAVSAYHDAPMRRTRTLHAALLCLTASLSACGGVTQGTRTAQLTPALALDAVGRAKQALPPETMSAARRAALEPMLARYGSGWSLSSLERGYTLSVVETPAEYTLTLTARGASGLRAVVHATRDGQLSNDALQIPAGPELSAEDHASAERIVRAARTAWINPYEGDTRAVDLSAGLTSLLGTTPRQSRRRGGSAVFYTRADEYGPLLVVVVDLASSQLTEVSWYDVPSSEQGLLPAADIAAIDEAMRRHGDFGVYGSVAAGLTALSHEARVLIRPTPRRGTYSVSVSSPDGHGHHLSFTVDTATRTLDGVAAGHMVSADE